MHRRSVGQAAPAPGGGRNGAAIWWTHAHRRPPLHNSLINPSLDNSLPFSSNQAAIACQFTEVNVTRTLMSKFINPGTTDFAFPTGGGNSVLIPVQDDPLSLAAAASISAE